MLRTFAIEGDPNAPGYGAAFMRTYLPHYMRRTDGTYVPPAEWHADFDRQVFGTLGKGVRRAFLAPRGYAKSTKVSLGTPLIALSRRLKRYPLLVQETGPQAKQAMAAIIHELDTNELLLRDFPHLARAYVDGRPVADRDDDIVFVSGARLQAVGAGGSLRGRRNKEQRPDLVLVDDLEDDEHVRTKYQRDKLDEWTSSALLGALSPDADVYLVGTLLHHDAVLARLMQRGAPWRPHTYHAITDRAVFGVLVEHVQEAVQSLVSEGGLAPGEWDAELVRSRIPRGVVEAVTAASTWPEMWDAMKLAAKRLEMGGAAFSREYLHDPVDESTQKFPRSLYRYRDVSERVEGSTVAISVDPATSEKSDADYSALSSIAKVGDAAEYDVLDVWRGRVSDDKLIRRITAEYAKWRDRGASVFVVFESVQAQVWGANAMRRAHVPTRSVRPNRDKVLRAVPASVLYENGQVWHAPHLRDGEFEAEMERFPAGEHDDMVDTVTYGLDELASAARPRVRSLA